MIRHPLGRYPNLHVTRSHRPAPGSGIARAVIGGALIWAVIALMVWL
jgi:hypothetical protein